MRHLGLENPFQAVGADKFGAKAVEAELVVRRIERRKKGMPWMWSQW